MNIKKKNTKKAQKDFMTGGSSDRNAKKDKARHHFQMLG